MYGGKCGAQNQDGATFCGVCGAPLGAPAGQPGAAPTAGTSAAVSQDSGKYKKIGIAAVAVVAVVAIFGIFSLFGGRSDKETAEKVFDAVFEIENFRCDVLWVAWLFILVEVSVEADAGADHAGLPVL